MTFAKRPVALVFLLMLPLASFAGKKKVSLEFQPSHFLTSACTSSPFILWHESGSFFKDLRQVKTKGVTQYRRGKEVVDSFPPEIAIQVNFLRGAWLGGACGARLYSNPKNFKFRAEWRNGSQSATAQGKAVASEVYGPGAWCEDSCTIAWDYELRIDSQDVPLSSRLFIRIDSEAGAELGEYTGEVTTIEPVNSLILMPSPLP